jgi:lysophospholipase L1-like esterase
VGRVEGSVVGGRLLHHRIHRRHGQAQAAQQHRPVLLDRRGGRSGAQTYALAQPAKLVEFVGDSITVGTTTSKNALTAYGWLIGGRLGARHTQIAQGGACLVTTAAIFAMQTFAKRFGTETRDAVRARAAAGDARVWFVDTTNWLTSADFTDGTHPTDAGHRKIADLLAPVIAAELCGPAAVR